MIKRPQSEDFRESVAIAALRETSEILQDAASPVKKIGRGLATAAWLYAMPMLLIPAWMIFDDRSPEIFRTFWAYLALVGLFGLFVWRQFWVPADHARSKQRRKQREGLEDTAALRAELQRS